MHAGVEGEGKVLVHKDGLEERAEEEGQGPHEADIVRGVRIVQPLDDVGGGERADKAQEILDELGNRRQVEAPAKGPAPPGKGRGAGEGLSLLSRGGLGARRTHLRRARTSDGLGRRSSSSQFRSNSAATLRDRAMRACVSGAVHSKVSPRAHTRACAYRAASSRSSTAGRSSCCSGRL